ncbi:peptidoglycan-binding protein [bacterium]|nr:peptidoglycan-binding protein [bacterium]
MTTKKHFGILAAIVFAASVFVSPVSAACTLQTLGECDQAGLMSLISSLSATPTVTPTVTPTASFGSIPAGFTFTQNLRIGARGEEVKYVQVFLNSDPDTKVAATGAGSAGNETTYFGPATTAAVKKFQAKYGISPVLGNWYSLTRAKANSLLATTPTTPTTPTDTGCLPGAAFSSTTGLPCTGTTTPTNPTVPVTGSLSVAIASDNPAVSTLISTQAIGDLAHYTFTNGSSAEVKITSVELTRLGVSADDTLRNVYLFNGVNRLTDAGSLSSGKVTFNDPNGLFTVPAGQTVTIAVKADIAADQSGQTVGIALSGVTTTATLAASLPLNGNIHSIANATLATVTIGTAQPKANAFVDPAAGTRIWEASFAVNNRDVKFTRLSLKQINSIDAKDIANFKLYIDGAEVATTASLSNGYAIFTFDKVLATGTRNVKVLADINGGSSRIIQMSLRNNADIDIRDVDYNVPVSPTGVPATTGQLTVNQGTTTVTVDNSALPDTIANNASGVLLGKWKVKANGENIRVEGLRFTGVGAGTGADSISSLKNGKVMINGAQYGSTAGLALTAGTLYNVNYTFQAGVETIVEFYADIAEDTTGATVSADATNNIAKGSTLTITFAVPTSANGTKQVSLGTVNVPTSASTAAGVTVADGTSGFTVVKTSNFGDQNLVVPKPATKIASFNVTAGTSEDIYVNNFRIAAANVGNTGFNKDDLADLYVVYTNTGATAVTTTPKNTVDATNDFPISFTLGKGKSVLVEVYASLQNNNTDAAGDVTDGDTLRTSLIVSGTGASSGVAVANTATNGQLITAKNANMIASRDATTAVSALADDNGTVKTVAYKFEAQNDDYSISRLVFTFADPSVVSTVSLKDGDTVLSTQSGASVVTFNLGTPVAVSANSTKILTVELTLASVGQGAGNTGAAITTNISLAGCLARSTNGALTAPGGTPVAGNGLYVYKAVPTISLVSLPTGTLGTGTQVISKFSVSTNGTGTVGWKQIAFNVSKSSDGTNAPAITAFEVQEVDSNTKVLATSATLTSADGADPDTGTDCSTLDSSCVLTFVATEEQQISGQKTYEVRATITDANGISTGEYINTSIPNGSTVYKASNTYANAAAAGNKVAANGALYTAAGAAVANADTRLNAVPQYDTTDVAAAATVVGHDAADSIVQAYGIPTGFTLTMAEGATDNQTAADTFTVSGVSGLTCTPYTGTDFTGAAPAGTAFASIQSILCTGNGMRLGLGTLAVTNDSDTTASSGTMTVTVTRGLDFASGTAVSGAGADSDIGTAVSAAGTPSFVWTDVSAQSHSVNTLDWTADYLVKNLPTSTQNLTK